MNKKTKLKLFETMYKIRQFEKAAYDLYTKNLIRGSIHLYIGEEAVAAGICANLKNGDCITSTHRGHGHCIAKGGNLKPMMAELLGRKTGYCRGKGGSMHIADPEIGIFGANGIVGGGIGIATGLAFSSKYFNQKKVVICFFGDGAFNQGILFEVINMSVAWKLPIIFVCENNYYALSTHFKDFSIDSSLTKKVGGFGIRTISVDGNDIEKVYNAAEKVVENTRKSNAPGFIETMTYRWTGHFLGDREIYRTRKEVNEWKKRCPIRRYEDRLVHDGFDIKELNGIKNKINLEVKEAVEFALESPQPEPGSIFEDIYSL